MIYFLQTEKKFLDEFELLRHAINLKMNTDEIENIINQMIDAISDKSMIEKQANVYPAHFSSSIITWQMEYDIAMKILTREKGSKRLTYVFELVNYSFYFLLLPFNFRNAFFLFHGLTVDQDITKWEKVVNKIKGNRYVVYKSGQELLNSFMCSEGILSEADELLCKEIYKSYDAPPFDNHSGKENRVYIFQLSERKK